MHESSNGKYHHSDSLNHKDRSSQSSITYLETNEKITSHNLHKLLFAFENVKSIGKLLSFFKNLEKSEVSVRNAVAGSKPKFFQWLIDEARRNYFHQKEIYNVLMDFFESVTMSKEIIRNANIPTLLKDVRETKSSSVEMVRKAKNLQSRWENLIGESNKEFITKKYEDDSIINLERPMEDWDRNYEERKEKDKKYENSYKEREEILKDNRLSRDSNPTEAQYNEIPRYSPVYSNKETPEKMNNRDKSSSDKKYNDHRRSPVRDQGRGYEPKSYRSRSPPRESPYRPHENNSRDYYHKEKDSFSRDRHSHDRSRDHYSSDSRHRERYREGMQDYPREHRARDSNGEYRRSKEREGYKSSKEGGYRRSSPIYKDKDDKINYDKYKKDERREERRDDRRIERKDYERREERRDDRRDERRDYERKDYERRDQIKENEKKVGENRGYEEKKYESLNLSRENSGSIKIEYNYSQNSSYNKDKIIPKTEYIDNETSLQQKSLNKNDAIFNYSTPRSSEKSSKLTKISFIALDRPEVENSKIKPAADNTTQNKPFQTPPSISKPDPLVLIENPSIEKIPSDRERITSPTFQDKLSRPYNNREESKESPRNSKADYRYDNKLSRNDSHQSKDSYHSRDSQSRSHRDADRDLRSKSDSHRHRSESNGHGSSSYHRERPSRDHHRSRDSKDRGRYERKDYKDRGKERSHDYSRSSDRGRGRGRGRGFGRGRGIDRGRGRGFNTRGRGMRGSFRGRGRGGSRDWRGSKDFRDSRGARMNNLERSKSRGLSSENPKPYKDKIYKSKREYKDRQRKKSVRFVDDKDLKQIIYFKATNEASHPPLSKEEIEPKEKFSTLSHDKFDDIKHRDIIMEAESLKTNSLSENSRPIDPKRLIPKINWYRPKAIKMEKIVKNIQSKEKEIFEDRIIGTLQVLYSKNIPDTPNFRIQNINLFKVTEPIQIRLANQNEPEVQEENKVQSPLAIDLEKAPLKSIMKKAKYNKQQLCINKAKKLNEEANRKRQASLLYPVEDFIMPEPIKSLVVSDKITPAQPIIIDDDMNPKSRCEAVGPAQLLGKKAALHPFPDNPHPILPPAVLIEPILNYKRVPCVFFHSPMGCLKGDDCSFIHHIRWAGRETPNMHRYVRPYHMLSPHPVQNEINIERLKNALESNFTGQFDSKLCQMPEEGEFRITGDSTLTLDMMKNFEVSAAKTQLKNFKRDIVPIVVDSATFNAEKGTNQPLIFLPPERPPEDNFRF